MASNEQSATNNIIKATRNLFAILRLDKKDISSIYFFAILGGLISLILPLGIQSIINFVMAGTISTSIIILIFIAIAGVFFNGLVQIRQMQITEKVKQKIFTRYSLEFANILPKLNIEKLDNYYLPELVNRYFDTPSLTKSLEKLLLDIPTAIIQILAGLVLLAFYHPVFIAFGVILIFIVIIIIRFTSPQGLATSLKASDYKYAIAGWLEEMARVIKSFKYGKKTDFHIRKTDYLVSHYLDSRTDHFKILLTQFWSLITFKIIITAAMLTVGVILLLDQSINVGQFIAADIVIIAIIASVEKLVSSLDKVYDTLTSIQKLNKVLDSEIEHNGSLELPAINKGVKVIFNNVSFCYPNGEQILNNLNLEVASGKVVNIVGKSGSGKSTILRLLTGGYKSYEGGILIDEVPLGNYNLTSLRNQTGVLLYQQDIFNGTLLQNITLGVKEFSTQQISELAEIFTLRDFIKGNKEGLDVMLDPLGKRLPSNIRQDILLMRALLGKHRLLILEHPFDYLSPEEKINLCTYLSNQKNTTIIVTSELPETQMKFDETYVLENGKITKLN